jgi:hypothetical protein
MKRTRTSRRPSHRTRDPAGDVTLDSGSHINGHVERPPSGEAARVPASFAGGRSARTCGWAVTSTPRSLGL